MAENFCNFHNVNTYLYHLQPFLDTETMPEQPQYSCQSCPSWFQSEDQLTDHQKIHETVTLYQCQKCDFVFTSIEELDSHYYTVHPHELENPAPFHEENNYQVAQPNSYPTYQQNPYQVNQQNYDYSCYRCNRYFYDFESLNHHAETEHKMVVMPNDVIQGQNDGIPNVIVEKHIVMPNDIQNALSNVFHKQNGMPQKQIVMPNVMPNVIQKQNVMPQKHVVMPNQAKFSVAPKRNRAPVVKIQTQSFKSQPQSTRIGNEYSRKL